MHRNATRKPSSHIARFSVGSMPKPPSSASDDDSPVPNSTRPPDNRSSVAMRSATRTGWLNAGGICTIPCPRRRLRVRCDTAARNTSGADEWLYSSRKWCSTSQHAWMPRRSASSHCSSAFSRIRRSEPASHGRGFWCSKNRPIFTGRNVQRCSTLRVGLADEAALLELGLHVVLVQQRDEVDRDRLGARGLALAMVRARTEVRLHGLDHVDRAIPALGLALRQEIQVLRLRRR